MHSEKEIIFILLKKYLRNTNAKLIIENDEFVRRGVFEKSELERVKFKPYVGEINEERRDAAYIIFI
jgi:hypothetical protein